MIHNVTSCGNYYMNLASMLTLASYSRSAADVHVMANIDNIFPLSESRRNSPQWKDPKVVAFDLDCTLWPFWVDTHVTPPFHKDKKGNVIDSRQRDVKYIPGVPEILAELHARGLKLAAVSRTGEVKGANQLLDLFDFRKYFSFIEIYPGSKILHFSKIHRETKIDYTDIIFFDDEFRNIVDTKKLGIFTIYCPDGVNAKMVDSALVDFDRSKKSKS